MTDRAIDRDPEVLAWCAVLGEASAGTLRELAGVDDGALRELVGRGELLARGELYALRDDERRRVLAELRGRRPRDEILLNERALHTFLGYLARGAAGARAAEAALRHLTALHDLSIEFMEWNLIVPHAAAARRSHRWDERALAWITFFEAYAATRTERFAAGVEQLQALRRRGDLDDDLRARVLHACSNPAADGGRYEEALALCREALALAEGSGDRFRQGYLQLSIGMIYNDLEDLPRALRCCERALEHFRAIDAGYRLAHALYELGNNAMRLGRWEQARQALDEAEARYQRLGITRRLAMTRWAQGWLHQMLGENRQAEAALREVLAIALDPAYGIPTAARDAFERLGLLYQTEGRYGEAADCLAQATAIAARYSQRHHGALYLYRQAEALRGAGRLAEAGELYREAVRGVEELRTATQIEELKLSLLGTAQFVYESLVLFCLDHESEAAAFEYVEQARARAFLDLLARQAPELYESFEQPTATLAEVQARLAPGELLLEYFTTGVLPPGDHPLNHIPAHNARLREQLVPPPQVLIFAVTRASLTVHRVPVDPNRLRPSRYAEDPVLHVLQAEGRFRWLYDRLVAPVAPLLERCSQVFIIPHGPLHYVPFAALQAPDGEFLLRAGGPALAIAPSATVLMRHCLARPPRPLADGVAIGFDDRAGAALEYAEAEARHVARLLGGEAWTGPQPKGDELLARAASIGWLHIAGHAIYDHETSLMSHLRLGQADDLDGGAIMGRMRLGAELVTLSSCMSGFSRVVPGDELLGLQRAFLYAGAATVVCALARTRDAVALLVMDAFYGRLRDGAPKAAALRDALVAVRTMPYARVLSELQRLGYRRGAADAEQLFSSTVHEDAPPFARAEYWAPFLLIGRPD